MEENFEWRKERRIERNLMLTARSWIVRKQGASLASWLTSSPVSFLTWQVKAVVVASAVAAAIAADERTQQDHRPMCIREQSRGFP